MKEIYEYNSYTDFLKDWINSRPKKGRGQKFRMAKFLGCIPAHITNVVNQDQHFTLDQAAKVIDFLELSKLEGQYFLGMVELARAGGPELRAIIIDRLEEIQAKIIVDLPGYDAVTELLDRESLETYVENWAYVAINVICSIPKYQKVEAICEYFNLPKNEVLKVLNFLVEKGIVKKTGDRYIRDLRRSLASNFPKIINAKYHYNWRARALNTIDLRDESNFHYTVISSISKKDIPIVKKALEESMGEIIKGLKGPREELFSICLDFFKVK